MSEGDRDEPLQFGGLIVALVVGVLACAIALLAYGRDHSEQRASAAAQYKHDRFLDCIALGVASPAQCKSQADQSRYDQSAESYDLKAQQDMAKWALLMLIVTGVGVALIAMTVWQTRGVLREAKEATSAANRTVDATNRIGDAQIRAYVGIQEVVTQRAESTGGKGHIRFLIRNFGQTTATDVCVVSTFLENGLPVGNPREHFLGLIDPQQQLVCLHPVRSATIPIMMQERLEKMLREDVHFLLKFHISYRDISGNIYDRVSDYQIVRELTKDGQLPFHVVSGTAQEAMRKNDEK